MLKETQCFHFNLHFLSILVVSFVFRMAFPWMKYLFIPVFAISLIYFGYLFIKQKTKFPFRIFFVYLGLYILLLIFYLFAIIRYNNFFLPLKEWIAGAIVLVLFFYHLLLITDKMKLNEFIQLLIRYIIYTAFLISLMGLFKFLLELNLKEVPYAVNDVKGNLKTSLTTDYNFYVLASLLGFIPTLFFVLKYGAVEKRKFVYRTL